MAMVHLELITSIANMHKVDPLLVQAIVAKESSGNTWAWNPEPKFRYFWDIRKKRPFRFVGDKEVNAKMPPLDFPALAGDPDQEWWGQQTSWGLMQIMGAVAREEGYTDPYLTSLCNPAQGLTAGVNHLSRLLAWAQGDVRAACAAYNGGRGGNAPGGVLRNGAYADSVLQIRNKL